MFALVDDIGAGSLRLCSSLVHYLPLRSRNMFGFGSHNIYDLNSTVLRVVCGAIIA